MKRKFLEDMGLTKEQVDSIMAENGSDIESAKGDLEQTKAELEQTKTQLQERDTQMETLKNSTGDMDALKQQIASLQSDNQATKEKYEADMKELKLSTPIYVRFQPFTLGICIFIVAEIIFWMII